MSIVNRSVLKGYFEKGDQPSQSQFATLIDSMVNRVEDGYLLGLRVYDPLKEYIPGDVTVFSDALYICTAATTGAFDSSKWNVIIALGAVVYIGTWNASSNSPALVDGTGSKGHYYVVSAAGTQDLGSGPIDFDISDWVIYNGTIWQKVDNSQAPVDASDVNFTPNGDITATNVQDAVVEVRDSTDNKLSFKADKVVGGTTDDLVQLDASGNLVDSGKKTTDFLPNTTVAANIPFTPNGDITATNVQDAVVEVRDDTDAKLSLKADKVSGATVDDIVILDASGNLADGGKKLSDYLAKDNTTPFVPSAIYNPATKQYVDDVDAVKADKVVGATTDDIAILSSTGNLVDGGKKLSDYLAKDNTTPFVPSATYNPATKQYVDDVDAVKADKVVGATTDDIAILSPTGNLVDGGKKLSDYLAKDNTTPFVPSAIYNPATKQYVDDVDAVKADKVVGATTDDIAVLNASGNLVDGGKKLSDYLSKTNTTAYTPTNDYHPATKIYVDNKFAAVPAQEKIVAMPFTFDTAYGTTSASFARVPAIQIIVPDAGDIFPGTTTITAKIFVDYLTQSTIATGEVGLTEWNFSGPAISLVGTAATLPATNNVWQKNTSPPTFTLPGGKTYQVIVRRTAGTGSQQVQIEGATLVLTFS